jgi:hypothetical protein
MCSLPLSLSFPRSNLPLPLFHLSPCPRLDPGEWLLPSVEPVVSSPLLPPLSPFPSRSPSACVRAAPLRSPAPARLSSPPARPSGSPVRPLSHPGFRGPKPGREMSTKCARNKSYTYDDSWYRNRCHNINI